MNRCLQSIPLGIVSLLGYLAVPAHGDDFNCLQLNICFSSAYLFAEPCHDEPAIKMTIDDCTDDAVLPFDSLTHRN
ncbi:hypothetical protein SPB21_10460 [Leptothoe sp. ISB3NOV94-8A]|uniref:hypothetical protein n=1 Tax=Adonisia turfae TaxID=2950184 RepID=UPI0013D50639|nr:hypothetical protein [Adonisia turfae]MDV3351873.1 hypothetical protein [Leptothoe sp. LEGE 181152]